jgi:hypothetical protein
MLIMLIDYQRSAQNARDLAREGLLENILLILEKNVEGTLGKYKRNHVTTSGAFHDDPHHAQCIPHSPWLLIFIGPRHPI